MIKIKTKLLSALAAANILISIVGANGLTVSADTTVNISSYADLVSFFTNTETTEKDVTSDFVLTADITVPTGATPLGSIVVNSIANPDYATAQTNVSAYNTSHPDSQIHPTTYYEWMRDNDFSDLTDTTNPIDDLLDTGLVTFKGTLDGKGHKISGLATSLFSSINGANIKDVAFVDVTSTSNVLAQNADSSTMQNSYAYSKTVTPVIALTGLTNTNVYSYMGERTKYEFYTEVGGSPTILEIPDFESGSYKITDIEDWNVIAKMINSSIPYEPGHFYSEESYLLMNDISVTTVPTITWGIDEVNKFKGTFNGQGYIITAATEKMLFGYIYGADILNLGAHIGVVDGNQTTDYIGGIAGNAAAQSTIKNCYFVGKSTNTKFGGIVGSLESSIVRNCYTRTTAETGGGLVNITNAGKFYNCYTTQGAAVYDVRSSNNNEFNNTYASASSSGISGITYKPIADMKKANFIPLINRNITGATYVYMNEQTPSLTGVGEGKNPGTAPVNYYKVTIKAPPAGCVFKVSDGTRYLDDGDEVAEGTTLTFSQQNTVGYVFRTYKVNDASYSTSSYEVNAPVTVEANFNVIEVYTITVKAGKGGTVSPSDATIKVNKGDTYTFTIVPDAGYKIKSVDYSGAGVTNSGKYYTTSIMIKNTNLDVEFISKSENVTNVEVGNDGNVVSVKSTLDIIDIIDENYGNTFRAPLSASNMIEDNVLDALKGKSATLILDGKDYSWSIYGKSITSSAKSINMEVEVNGKDIPEKYLNLIKKFENQIQLKLKHDGPFPFRGRLTFNVGEDQAGRYANLFYFNPNKLKLEIEDSTKVDRNGDTYFDFIHASNYVVVMADKPLTYADLSQQAGMYENQQLISDNSKPLLYSGLLFIAVLIGAVVVFNIIRKYQ